jgi:tetratricopeptide (TPR) repeat protein
MRRWVAVTAVIAVALLLISAAQDASLEERLARHRTLGKAFYENPATQKESVEEFRNALALAPDSIREQLNYALALLRAGKTDEATGILQKVQARDPKLPHTWFNLGITWKKAGIHDRALAQFQQLVKLTPDDAIAHYNLGAMLKITGNQDGAMREFERAAQLDPSLAAPHFQLFNAYRTAGRQELAKTELEKFQRIKKQQEGAAIPEDVDWNFYAEIYDPIESRKPEPAVPLRFASRTAPGEARDSASSLADP